MSAKISNVIVDKISLVTKDETPAVPKAGFKIFKMFRKTKFTKTVKEKLERIAKGETKSDLNAE
jgi:hypothetical protein